MLAVQNSDELIYILLHIIYIYLLYFPF